MARWGDEFASGKCRYALLGEVWVPVDAATVDLMVCDEDPFDVWGYKFLSLCGSSNGEGFWKAVKIIPLWTDIILQSSAIVAIL